MSDISALGLGLMGSAVARSFVNAGHRLTVWHRSAAKTRPLVQLGASAAGSVPAAVTASPIVLICIDSYRTTRTLFDKPDVISLLPGRTIVHLTTATPTEPPQPDPWFTPPRPLYL